ncbi:hypothetical protein GCM10011367_07960 [Marinicauda pacifica]|jgi:outer membrane protein|uniref:OmpH family outer membrane protein n=1 Tax=Marinicauda pacifica TaxID=1133559 RepID=A0A4S2HFL2_9PROT|nr:MULTISPECIES: OmpH family outer membrane protein [Marinicauda]TGY94452.1 OmpH family outer membrane protein [Marinicauda pacifica]GGE35962.1 hypothetical protein GCM10011367_07960 [Marinicauda pacifica]
MLRTFSKLLSTPARLLLASLALAGGLAGAASAQNVLVMNEQRILAESAVGQHIATRVEQIGNEIAAELTPIREQIQSESEALNTETSSLTEDAIQQRPDLAQRFQALQVEAQRFEQTRQVRQRELQVTQRRAMVPVMEALEEILQEIVNERGADILIDRANLVFATEAVDISDAAIQRLNSRMTTTPVNRVRLSVNEAGEVQMTEDQ